MFKTGFMQAVRELIGRIDASIPPEFDGEIRATCVGGVATHVHTSYRVSDDCDVIFDHKLIVPQGLVVAYRNEDGAKHALAFDTNYASEISLIHPDATCDAVHLEKVGRIAVSALNPTDLAVTKIGRWTDVDLDDVRQLAKEGLLDEDAVTDRVNEALGYYIGDRKKIEFNLRDALEIIRECKPGPKRD